MGLEIRVGFQLDAERELVITMTERPLEERLRILADAKVRLDKLHGDQITRQVEHAERIERGELEDYDFPALRKPIKPREPQQSEPEPQKKTMTPQSDHPWQTWVRDQIRAANLSTAEAIAEHLSKLFAVKKADHEQVTAALQSQIDALKAELTDLRNANAKSKGWFR